MTPRYIVVGLGNIGVKRKIVLKNKLVATVDIKNKSADYKNYKDVSLNDFEAVVLSIPNSEKIILMKYFLKNGKHVIVEKPLLFKNKKEATELKRIAEKNECIWYTSYNHRFEPNIQKLKELIDKKIIGEIYFTKMIYGNGTVQNIVNTWRDVGHGVIEDLGCHLIDLANYLFKDNWNSRKYKLNDANNFEAKTWDFSSFSSVDNHLHFICSTLVWKNTFKVEVFGSKGSIYLDGLNKWGLSKIIIHKRVFPSGVPEETIITSSINDDTWEKDIDFFETMISRRETSYKNDLNISQSIKSLTSRKKGV